MNLFSPRNFRLVWPILVALVLTVIVLLIAPQQGQVTLYKLSLIFAAGGAGYWLDRACFPYARPDSYLYDPDWDKTTPTVASADNPVVPGYELVFAFAMLRRAIIVSGAMIAVCLGS